MASNRGLIDIGFSVQWRIIHTNLAVGGNTQHCFGCPGRNSFHGTNIHVISKLITLGIPMHRHGIANFIIWWLRRLKTKRPVLVSQPGGLLLSPRACHPHMGGACRMPQQFRMTVVYRFGLIKKFLQRGHRRRRLCLRKTQHRPEKKGQHPAQHIFTGNACHVQNIP